MTEGQNTMALATATVPGKKTRKGGARIVKDRVVYALFKGSVESLNIVDTAEQALDAKEADPSLVYRKITIPARKSMRKTADAVQNGQPATA